MEGKYRNLEWLELEGGLMTECAIMERSLDGHTWFFPVASLDAIDRQRLLNILRNRNADMYSLWDLMSQITLGNGINALTYFNQLVKVLTPQGQVVPFSGGRYGAPLAAPSPYAEQSQYTVNQTEPTMDQVQLQQAVTAAKAPVRPARK
jgi:hypothetical protein